MDFCTLTDIIKSNLVPAEDHKRAIACYRRVCAIDKPLNTTVHIDFDVHVYEVHSDQSVRYVQTLDSRKYHEIRVNMSSIPQQLFGNASHPPANRSESTPTRPVVTRVVPRCHHTSAEYIRPFVMQCMWPHKSENEKVQSM